MCAALSSLLCLSLLAFSGCEKQADNTPILSVNGVAYGQADWDRDIAVRETLFAHRAGKKDLSDQKKLAQRREGLRFSTLSAFVNDTLWRQAVGETGTAVRAGAAYSESLANVQARYRRTFGHPGETFEDLVSLFTDPRDRDRLSEIVALASEQDAYCTAYFGDDYVVSSNLVEKVLEKVRKMNDVVAVTNAAIFATASNVVARARAGEDFAKLADEFSRDEGKQPGGALGECDAADFPLDKETLWPVLKDLKTGGVTDVIDTEDGICIYRCNKVVEESKDTGEFALDLSRIVFYRALEYPVLTFDQCKAQLESESRQEVLGKILGSARETVRIDCPQGESALPKAFLRKFGKFIRRDRKEADEESPNAKADEFQSTTNKNDKTTKEAGK